MQMQPKRSTPPSGRRWRRRSVLTCSSMTIVDVVLSRGTDAASLRALRATCTSLRDALRDVTQFRLRERCAHVQRVLPKSTSLRAITAVLADDEDAEDPHLQLDEGLVDVASLRGTRGPRRGVGLWSWKGGDAMGRCRCCARRGAA